MLGLGFLWRLPAPLPGSSGGSLPCCHCCILRQSCCGYRFDIIYALQDDEFDRSPVVFRARGYGRNDALRLSSVLHPGTPVRRVYPAGFCYLYHNIQLSDGSTGYTAIFIVLLVYQHTLVKPHDLSRVNPPSSPPMALPAFFWRHGDPDIYFKPFLPGNSIGSFVKGYYKEVPSCLPPKDGALSFLCSTNWRKAELRAPCALPAVSAQGAERLFADVR